MEKLEELMKKNWAKDATKEDELQNQKKDLDGQYIPIDFDSYSIVDKELKERDQALSLLEEDKIWRISSLTMFIDADTKILLLPLAESKRKIKIRDTKYDFSSISDMISQSQKINSQLSQDD